MAAFYVPSYGNYSYGKQDEEQSSSNTPRRQKATTSKSGFYTPSYSAYTPTKKEQADTDAKKKLDELAKQEQAKNTAQKSQRNIFQKIGDFTAAANENFLQGGEKSLLNIANFVGSGGNAKETEKRTSDFLRTTHQVNNQGQANLASGPNINRNSGSFKAGQTVGNIESTAADIGTLAIPAFGASKVVKGLEAVDKLSKGGKAARIGAKVAENAAGSLAGTAVGAVQDIGHGREQDLAKNAAIGTAADIAMPVVGKVAGKIAKATGLDKAAAKAVSKVKETSVAAKASSQAAEDAAIRKQVGVPDLSQDASQTLKTGPESQVGNAVENVRTKPGETPKTPGVGESRYVSKTLPDSDFVDAGTKAKLGASYDKTTNASRADQSLYQMDAEGVDNFATKVHSRLDDKHITDQTVFDAQAAAQALEKRGDEASLQSAADIYNKLSTHLSKAGQTVQAAAIMARQTPEGLSYYAQKQFKKAGVDFSPELQKDLRSYIDDVKNTTPKSAENAIARDNVQYFIASHLPTSKTDKVINFWRAGLLTSPTTTAGAIAGNTAQALQKNLITDPVATLADMVISLKTGKRTSAAASIGSTAKGAAEGAKVLGSKQYRKTGFNPLDTANSESTKFNQPRVTNYGNGALGKATGAYVNGVYKLMGSADIPFRNAAHSKALSSIANSEAINKGLKGDEKKAFVQDFLKNPPESALNTANKEAEAAVFANDTRLGKAATNLAKNLGPVGQILIPFSKVPSAVATKVVTSTPLGTANEIVKQIINVRKGGEFDQRALAKAIGEGTTGVPIIGAGYALGNSGAITGGYPSTQAERDQWTAEGKKPNSIRIGDKWYSLNYIQPFATLLATGAKAAEAEKSGLDLGEVISQASAATGQSVLSQSFLQGLSSAIDAVKNPADFGASFVANTAGSVVPNFIKAAASATDTTKREATNPLEGIASGIPGLRQTLNPKLDSENQPIQNNANFLDQYVNPLKPTPANVSPDAEINNQAIIPAKNLKTVRMKGINQLLSQGKVNAAQRKIDEYNQQLTDVIGPYVASHPNLDQDQVDKLTGLYLGQVWINKKGQPSISSRKDLPK